MFGFFLFKFWGILESTLDQAEEVDLNFRSIFYNDPFTWMER
jgi:hypothetical protein